MAADEIMRRKKTWKLEETTDDWKSNNLEENQKKT
jgi:hypothetical protein